MLPIALHTVITDSRLGGLDRSRSLSKELFRSELLRTFGKMSNVFFDLFSSPLTASSSRLPVDE